MIIFGEFFFTMPKVINQTGVSVDSLQIKLTLLESQFTKLSSEHKVVLDSLRLLDKTIQKADIATTFYDTHLATYTGIFAVFIGLIAAGLTAYNIFGIYRPIVNKFQTLQDVDIPNSIAEIKKESRKEIKKLKSVNRELKDLALDGVSWGLKGMMSFYETTNNHKATALFVLRYCEYILKFTFAKEDQSELEVYLNYADEVIQNNRISIEELQDYESELSLIFKLIFEKANESNVSTAVRCRENLFTNNLPKTALDVVRSDELIPTVEERPQD